jgi:hypothetical protein
LVRVLTRFSILNVFFYRLNAHCFILGQIGKILGDKWKEMTDSDKTPYVTKAEADKKRYEKEKAEHDGKE